MVFEKLWSVLKSPPDAAFVQCVFSLSVFPLAGFMAVCFIPMSLCEKWKSGRGFLPYRSWVMSLATANRSKFQNQSTFKVGNWEKGEECQISHFCVYQTKWFWIQRQSRMVLQNMAPLTSSLQRWKVCKSQQHWFECSLTMLPFTRAILNYFQRFVVCYKCNAILKEILLFWFSSNLFFVVVAKPAQSWSKDDTSHKPSVSQAPTC